MIAPKAVEYLDKARAAEGRDRILYIMEAVNAEYEDKAHKGTFVDGHHAYGAIMEEVCEFWDAVKADDLDHAVIEAVQIMAPCLKFIAGRV